MTGAARPADRADVMARVWCLLAAILIGTALGEVVYFWVTGRWLKGDLKWPIAFTLFLVVCMVAVAFRVRSTSLRAAIVVSVLLHLSSYWTPSGGWSREVWAGRLLMQTISGGFFALAGWAASSRFRVFALTVTVAFLEYRYVTLRYLDKLRSYPSVIEGRFRDVVPFAVRGKRSRLETEFETATGSRNSVSSERSDSA